MRYRMSNMASDNYARRAEAGQVRIQSFAFVISVCGCAMFSIGFAASGFVGPQLSPAIELDEKVNPNDAPAVSLVRLPGIGVSRAEAIVAYRDDFSNKDSDGRAFRNCDDLLKIRGIGPKTVQNICQWLKFE